MVDEMLISSSDRGDAIKGHVTVNGDKISKAVKYRIIYARACKIFSQWDSNL